MVADSGSKLAATTDTYWGGGVSPPVGPWKSRPVCETLTAGAADAGDEVRLNAFEATLCAASRTWMPKL